MAIEFLNPLTAGTVLIRSDIRSQNFVSGSAGWRIEADGDAEFNSIVIRGGTVVSGLALYYDGTPALGNLIMSISAAAGVDSFGNAYLAGTNVYSGASFAGLSDGNLRFGLTADGFPPAGLVGLSGADGLFASSPTSVADPDAATWALVDGDTAVTPQSAAGYPHLDVGASTSGVTGWINGAWVRSTVSGGTSTAETWHTPSFNANWSGTTTFGALSGGLRTLQYRKDAEDNVWLDGTFVAAAGAGSAVFQLPVGYRPAVNTPIPVAFISSGGVAGNAWLYVSAAGNLNINAQLGSAVTTGTAYTINGKIPLGNVA